MVTLLKGEKMKEEKYKNGTRINPEEAICPAYDATGIKLFSAPDRKEMGVPVLDNFPEEHIQ